MSNFLKLFILSGIIFLISCNGGKADLTIDNLHNKDMSNVEWNGTSFGNIPVGSKVTKEVEEGSSEIYFTFPSGSNWKTTESITVTSGEDQTYTIYTSHSFISRN